MRGDDVTSASARPGFRTLLPARPLMAVVLAAALFAPVLPATLVPAAAQEAISPGALDALPHDEALRLLGGALRESVTRSQSDESIPDILAALDRNIEATRRIRDLAGAEGTIITEELMLEIAGEVTTIARSFREIADMAPEVFQRRLQAVGTIEAVGGEVGFRIADARGRLAFLAEDNQRIQNALVRGTQLRPSEIEKLRLTQQANNAETHSLNAAIEAWGFFGQRHNEITARMGDQSEDLDVFFHALRENARVYEAAAQTLNLANSLKLALSELESVQNLDAMRSSLVESWGDLMRIVDEVNEGLLLQPGM